jgi:hypothetical protein
MKKIILGAFLAINTLFGHTAIMSCFDNGDNTITCEGGFSDGSSASGVVFKVEQNGKTLIEGKMSEDSEFTFKKPQGDYRAVFDAGEGHTIIIKGSEITQ